MSLSDGCVLECFIWFGTLMNFFNGRFDVELCILPAKFSQIRYVLCFVVSQDSAVLAGIQKFFLKLHIFL